MIDRGSNGVPVVSTKAVGTQHKSGHTSELGCGGKLGGFKFAHPGFQAIDATTNDGELLLKLLHQALQLVGDLGDPIQASVKQGGRFIAGHRPGTAIGAVGVTGHTAVFFDQVGQRLVSPIGGSHIRKLIDACDLILAGVLINATDVQVGGLDSNRGHKAERRRGQQQLLEKFHGVDLTRQGAMRHR